MTLAAMARSRGISTSSPRRLRTAKPFSSHASSGPTTSATSSSPDPDAAGRSQTPPSQRLIRTSSGGRSYVGCARALLRPDLLPVPGRDRTATLRVARRWQQRYQGGQGGQGGRGDRAGSWRCAQAPVTVLGDPSNEDLDACCELGAAMAVGLSLPAGWVEMAR